MKFKGSFLLYTYIRGGHLFVKTDPPDKSGRLDHPPLNTYSDGYGLGYLFFLDFGWATDIMFLVGWLPDPPDQISIHTNFSLTRPLFSLSFSFLTLSPQLLSHNTDASPSAFSLSFTVTSSWHFFTSTGSRQLLHRHGQALSSQLSLSTFA